jgi:NAD(P)-dependent dehydrogenase (short-subunit alcohol dehydrogenase family)
MTANLLNGQWALVTGASRGIGRAIALRLAARRRQGHRHGNPKKAPRRSARSLADAWRARSAEREPIRPRSRR